MFPLFVLENVCFFVTVCVFAIFTEYTILAVEAFMLVWSANTIAWEEAD